MLRPRSFRSSLVITGVRSSLSTGRRSLRPASDEVLRSPSPAIAQSPRALPVAPRRAPHSQARARRAAQRSARPRFDAEMQEMTHISTNIARANCVRAAHSPRPAAAAAAAPWPAAARLAACRCRPSRASRRLRSAVRARTRQRLSAQLLRANTSSRAQSLARGLTPHTRHTQPESEVICPPPPRSCMTLPYLHHAHNALPN
eukprot:2673055-Pleurochrysis_carterae.AAC.1